MNSIFKLRNNELSKTYLITEIMISYGNTFITSGDFPS